MGAVYHYQLKSDPYCEARLSSRFIALFYSVYRCLYNVCGSICSDFADREGVKLLEIEALTPHFFLLLSLINTDREINLYIMIRVGFYLNKAAAETIPAANSCLFVSPT